MDTSIIIVNWNGAHLLPGCLDALRDQSRPADEVIVVDNASSDGSVDLLRSRYPWVRLIELDTNSGLARGTNVGIARAHGEIVVALNNDTIPAPTWLADLCAPLEADPDLGSAMSTMLFAHNTGIIASAGLQVYQNGLVVDHLVGDQYSSVSHAPRPIFGPSAGAAAYRRSMLADIGGFDEDFFMYLEDADLAWRARLRGWESVYVPTATTLHIYSASSGQGSQFKQYHLARNRLWCLRKNLPTGFLRSHWRTIIGYDLGAVAYALLSRQTATIRGRADGLRAAHISAKRKLIQSRRTVDNDAIGAWLQPPPHLKEILHLNRRIAALSTPTTPVTQKAP